MYYSSGPRKRIAAGKWQARIGDIASLGLKGAKFAKLLPRGRSSGFVVTPAPVHRLGWSPQQPYTGGVERDEHILPCVEAVVGRRRGHTGALLDLAERRERAGDRAGAEALAVQAADRGRPRRAVQPGRSARAGRRRGGVPAGFRPRRHRRPAPDGRAARAGPRPGRRKSGTAVRTYRRRRTSDLRWTSAQLTSRYRSLSCAQYCRARGAILIVSTPAAANTASNADVNLATPSRRELGQRLQNLAQQQGHRRGPPAPHMPVAGIFWPARRLISPSMLRILRRAIASGFPESRSAIRTTDSRHSDAPLPSTVSSCMNSLSVPGRRCSMPASPLTMIMAKPAAPSVTNAKPLALKEISTPSSKPSAGMTTDTTRVAMGAGPPASAMTSTSEQVIVNACLSGLTDRSRPPLLAKVGFEPNAGSLMVTLLPGRNCSDLADLGLNRAPRVAPIMPQTPEPRPLRPRKPRKVTQRRARQRNVAHSVREFPLNVVVPLGNGFQRMRRRQPASM